MDLSYEYAATVFMAFFAIMSPIANTAAFIGENLSIVTRLMGLILAVIGVQMLLIGIKAALHISAAN